MDHHNRADSCHISVLLYQALRCILFGAAYTQACGTCRARSSCMWGRSCGPRDGSRTPWLASDRQIKLEMGLVLVLLMLHGKSCALGQGPGCVEGVGSRLPPPCRRLLQPLVTQHAAWVVLCGIGRAGWSTAAHGSAGAVGTCKHGEAARQLAFAMGSDTCFKHCTRPEIRQHWG